MARIIDIHILQTFPYNNINRGEDGAPKSCLFGGVERARISSQCLKRAIREDCAERAADLFAGFRTRLIASKLLEALIAKGVASETAEDLSKTVAKYLSKKPKPKKGKDDEDEPEDGPEDSADSEDPVEGEGETKTLVFTTPQEIDRIAAVLAHDPDRLLNKKNEPAKKGKPAKKNEPAKEDEPREIVGGALKKILDSTPIYDNADIALMGRMVATDPSLKVEGALSVAHAFSVHEARHQLDFFTALDECQDHGKSGAAFTDTALFSAATYYKCMSLNVDQLKANMGETGSVRTALDTVLRSMLRAVPRAKHTSAFAATYPGYALIVVRDKASPISLGDLFEKPLSGNYLENAWKRLQSGWQNMKKQCGTELGVILGEGKFTRDLSEEQGTDIDTVCTHVVDWALTTE